MNNSQKREVVRAYKQGMSIPDIAKLFSVGYRPILNTVYNYIVKGVRYV